MKPRWQETSDTRKANHKKHCIQHYGGNKELGKNYRQEFTKIFTFEKASSVEND